MTFSAEAPSNIALIKYMGKVPLEGDTNRPANASLSYTLEHLRTRVEITLLNSGGDQWQPLGQGEWQGPKLSEKGQQKFLRHFQHLKQVWGVQGEFLIRSGNNFPSDCGIASSASSFAALTLATYEILKQQRPQTDMTMHELSSLSRRGSGSSIRSFFGPLVLWDADGARELNVACPIVHHELILVDASHKLVSSSDAHLRVTSSALFSGRVQRAEDRLQRLQTCLTNGDWNAAWQICWDEFLDMHMLFMTAQPPFSYMTAGTMTVLNTLVKMKADQVDLPLVTMDAGANVHLLYRAGQETARTLLRQELSQFEFIGG